MTAISKRFPGVVALDGVDFEVSAGEIVALVGENGAGKSTLMKILAGIHRADSGEIRFDGTLVSLHNPPDAARLGIGVIHQQLEVIDTLDVAGNVFLGHEPRRGPLRLLDHQRMRDGARRALARIGANIGPDTPLRRLSTAERQFVAIARALSMNVRLLVLDEPTSSLTSSDAERLFDVLRDLKSSGTAIVYISHRLGEIEELADRACVLRDGKNAGTLPRDEISRDRIVRLMVGRSVDSEPSRQSLSMGPTVLQVDRLRTERFPAAEVSFTVHKGEILGIAGLTGSGRSEVVQAICGVGPRLAGQLYLDGKPITIGSPREAIRLGICLVPEDRRRCGVVAPMSVRENVSLPGVAEYARYGIIARAAEVAAVRRTTAPMMVKAASLENPVSTLSGGNQQKIALAKWLALRPRVIVFDEPTQGVDVRAKVEIHRLIRGLADEGAAVVMISSDMEEIVTETDRVAVMHDGRITGILPRADISRESIMHLAVA